MELLAFIKKIMYGYRFYIATIFASGLLIVVSTSSIPYYLGLCFQEMKDFGEVRIYHPLILLIVCYIIRSIFKLVRNHFAATLGTNVVMKIRLFTIENLIKNFSIKSTKNTNVYSILTYDLEAFSEIISWRTFVFIEDLLILIVSFYNMILISWKITICIIPGILVIFFMSLNYSKNIEKYICRIRDSVSSISSTIYENIVGQKVIRTLNAQNFETEKFNRLNMKNFQLRTDCNLVDKRYLPLMEFIAYLNLVIIIILSSWFVVKGSLDISVVVIFNGYMWLLIGTAGSLSSLINFYVNSKESFRRVSKHLDFSKNEKHLKNMAIKGRVNTIKVEKLRYSLNNIDVLRNIDITFKKGTITTITGEIGSGKTIFMDILSGLCLDYKGRISVDTTDINDLRIDRYRECIGYVTQEPVFFNTSIRENIILGREGISSEELSNTLIKCRLDKVIERLEFKLETVINKDSNFLSGGEKQRLCIARALIGKPDILILDDSVTAIDSDNQVYILESIKALCKDMIIIFVSNLEYVIANSDFVYLLSEGRLDYLGQPKEVLYD